MFLYWGYGQITWHLPTNQLNKSYLESWKLLGLPRLLAGWGRGRGRGGAARATVRHLRAPFDSTGRGALLTLLHGDWFPLSTLLRHNQGFSILRCNMLQLWNMGMGHSPTQFPEIDSHGCQDSFFCSRGRIIWVVSCKGFETRTTLCSFVCCICCNNIWYRMKSSDTWGRKHTMCIHKSRHA